MPEDRRSHFFIHQMLDRAARISPAARAVSDSEKSWTYAELADKSVAASVWLNDRGVCSGDRVVVSAGPDCRVIAMLYAASRLGATFVPVDPKIGLRQLKHVLDDATPSISVGIPQGLDSGVPRHTMDEVWPDSADETTTMPAAARPGPALLIYTSGSTAMPKAVVCPHAAVGFAAEAIQTRLHYRATDVVFCRLPLTFDYGLYQALLCALAGAELTLAGPECDGRLLAEIRQRRATVFPLVPGLARMLLTLATRDDLPTALRLFTNTGEELIPRIAAELRSRFQGAAIALMYGITECKRVTVLEADGDLVRPGSVGRPLDRTWIRITDDRDMPLPAGQLGHILVGGPHVMSEYWRSPELSARVFDSDEITGDRMLRTGDYGYVDADGYLYFAGRRDDIFKLRGVRTSSQEIAAAAHAVSGVREAVVLPPAPPAAAVLCVTGSIDESDLLRAVRQLIDPAKIPARCHVFHEVPRTGNGKVDKTVLREWVDSSR